MVVNRCSAARKQRAQWQEESQGRAVVHNDCRAGLVSEIAKRAQEIDRRNCAARNGHRRRHRNERKKRRFAREGISRFIAKIIAADVAEQWSWNIRAMSAATIDTRRRLIIAIRDWKTTPRAVAAIA